MRRNPEFHGVGEGTLAEQPPSFLAGDAPRGDGGPVAVRAKSSAVADYRAHGSPVLEAGREKPGVGDGASAGVSSGLVYTGTSPPERAWTWLANAQFEAARRLSKMRRRTITRARVQSQEVGEHEALLATMTYAPGHQWNPWHVSRCVDAMRKFARAEGIEFRYEWCAELQLKRLRRTGELPAQVLHYHMLVWVPVGFAFPFLDQVGWWPHGMTNVERASNPVGYIAKYASKGNGDFPLPRGCRVSGGGGLSEIGRREVAWWMLPRYVRERFPEVGQRIARARGGGWLNWDTGEFFAPFAEVEGGQQTTGEGEASAEDPRRADDGGQHAGEGARAGTA